MKKSMVKKKSLKDFEPTNESLKKAFIIWEKSFLSSSHFIKLYKEVHKGKRGAPTETEQDLLRSALIFACTGLDAYLKQVIEDNINYLVEKEQTTREHFEKFIEKKIKQGNGNGVIDYSFLAKIITNDDPKQYLINEWKDELQKDSLQSIERVIEICKILSLDDKKIIGNKKDMEKYKDIFRERNKIAHEMDINFYSHSNRNRNSRKLEIVSKQCTDILALVNLITQFLDMKIK